MHAKKCRGSARLLKTQKIAFCVPNMIIGGVETVLTNTLQELSTQPDIELRIITHAKIREPKYIKWIQEHPEIPVYVYYPLCNWFEDWRKYCRIFPLKQLRKIAFSLYKKYRRTLVSHRSTIKDIDIFIDYKNLEFYREIRKIPGRKIAWVHGPVEYILGKHSPNRIKQYDKIIGLTDDFVSSFKQILPQYADKVMRIYNPINSEEIRKKALHGKTIEGKYFCQVSRLDSTQKDIETLINGFDIFWQRNGQPDIKLLIIGSGPDEKQLKQLALSKVSHSQIIFTGQTDNPFGYIKGALASILSTKYEGLPTVLIESAVLGVPVISADCRNGPREILLNGDAGFLFQVGNANELANTMEYVINNQNIASQKAAVATEKLGRFTPKDISIQILKLIRS